MRELIEAIGAEGCGRHDAVVAVTGRLVQQRWSDAEIVDFLAPLVNAAFKEGDWTGEIEAAVAHARRRERERLQAGKMKAAPSLHGTECTSLRESAS